MKATSSKILIKSFFMALLELRKRPMVILELIFGFLFFILSPLILVLGVFFFYFLFDLLMLFKKAERK